MSPNLKNLIEKLNGSCRSAMTHAASMAVNRGEDEIGIDHVLLALCKEKDADLRAVCARHAINYGRLRDELEASVESRSGCGSRTPVFSVEVIRMMEQAWLQASLRNQLARIRTRHLIAALASDAVLKEALSGCTSQLTKVDLSAIVQSELEEGRHRTADDPISGESELASLGKGDDDGRSDSVRMLEQHALNRFTINLTQRAKDGQIDPVVGRDSEIRQMIDILLRRRQNNPILTGEAGVGKTAVVEGLALRIAKSDVPAVLKNVAILALDLGLLQAGAGVKGEFENRLKSIIAEVKASPTPIILFIDEAHTLIGAGGQSGQSDAANLLKPALARGELRTIGATTWSEYKKYFEKDSALARRFQVVSIEEPSEEVACAMVRSVASVMEAHFQVQILNEAITEAVKLSRRYLTERQLPDKAVSLLDTACAKVALGLDTMPLIVEEKRRKLERIAVESKLLEREAVTQAAHQERLADLSLERECVAAELMTLEAQWKRESDLAQRLRDAYRRLDRCHDVTDESPNETSRSLEGARAEIDQLLSTWQSVRGVTPLVPVKVDKNIIASIVSEWTNVPLGKLLQADIDSLSSLESALGKRVIGQDHALSAVAQCIRVARTGLSDPDKPKGVFLFVGPSGVGKTETALALADTLFGSESKLITINMSEYQEAHRISGLKGAPPGYVGYGEGGILTEAVRRAPYSVVLLDEVEKAHPDVLELFFQVFDKGTLEDGEGREVDFRNTTIILTSNAASSKIMEACLNCSSQDRPSVQSIEKLIYPVLVPIFKPAFLGRLQVVPFYPLPDCILDNIIRLKLDKIAKRIQQQHRVSFRYDQDVVDIILSRCTEVDTGARNVDHLVNSNLLPSFADRLLAGLSKGKPIRSVKVSVNDAGEFRFITR